MFKTVANKGVSLAARTEGLLGRRVGAMSMSSNVKEETQKGHKDVTTNIKSSHNENVIWSDALLDREERQKYLQSKHIGCTLYVTGLSGSGKSTVGAALEHKLLQMGVHAYRLEFYIALSAKFLANLQDNIRFGLNAGLGFSAADREENLRRIGEVAALFADSGVVAITSFISPYKRSRENAREIHKRMGVPFYEVFADVPLEVAESRDPKGLYKKARAGEIKNFTGISDPYEAPDHPDLVLPTHQLSVEESCEKTIQFLKDQGIIRSN